MNTPLYIAATASTPEIDCRFDQRVLSFKGEAYPENAAEFWGPVMQAIQQFLQQDDSGTLIIINVDLSYFNSSSTKMLFALFNLLDGKAAEGTPVMLNWYHDEEDEIIYEFGQELCEDFTHLDFRDHAESR